jgi:hypothetical protein
MQPQGLLPTPMMHGGGGAQNATAAHHAPPAAATAAHSTSGSAGAAVPPEPLQQLPAGQHWPLPRSDVIMLEPHRPGLYVGNLPWWATEQEVADLVCPFGNVLCLRILHDKTNGQPATMTRDLCIVTHCHLMAYAVRPCCHHLDRSFILFSFIRILVAICCCCSSFCRQESRFRLC